MPRQLKVFRTVTGFHDAYVATPSRAAALRAWGATTDLFAMDAAEQVADPKLMAAPLAKPGEVIKRVRGSEDEHLAAGGPVRQAKAKVKSPSVPKAKPRPSRAGLEKAERRLANAEANRARESEAFEREKAALREREEIARRAFDAKRSQLDAARKTQADAYEKALADWRAS